jgi:hypothetical protein
VAAQVTHSMPLVFVLEDRNGENMCIDWKILLQSLQVCLVKQRLVVLQIVSLRGEKMLGWGLRQGVFKETAMGICDKSSRIV